MAVDLDLASGLTIQDLPPVSVTSFGLSSSPTRRPLQASMLRRILGDILMEYSRLSNLSLVKNKSK